MERLYKESDWDEIEAADPRSVKIRDTKVPYGILLNEPEITDKPDVLGRELEKVCADLWSALREASPL